MAIGLGDTTRHLVQIGWDSSEVSRGSKDMTRDLTTAEKQATGSLDRTGDAADRTGGKFRKGLALGAKAGAVALAGMVPIAAKAVSNASDLNESMSKTENTFGKAAKTIPGFNGSVARSLGMSRAAALDNAAAIGSMLIPMGKSKGEAAKMSAQVLKLATDMGSFHNQDPTEMLERIQAGLSGEMEPLKRYGIILSEARVQQEALRLGLAKRVVDQDAVKTSTMKLSLAEDKYTAAVREHGKGSDEERRAAIALATAKKGLQKAREGSAAKLSEEAKVEARMSLLMRDSATAQGDFERTSKGLANQQRILKAQIEDFAAALGMKLLPAVAGTASALTSLMAFLGRHKGTVQVVIGVVASLAAGLVVLGTAVKLAAGYQAVLNAVMLANPIVLVVAAIAALSVGLVLAYKNSEKFREIVTGALDGVVVAGKAVAGFFTDTIPGAFDSAKKWVAEYWPEIATLVSGPFAPLVILATDAFGIRSAFQDAFSATLRWVKGKASEIVGLGKDISGAFVQGVKAVAWDWPKLIKERVVDAITEKLGEVLGKGKDISNKVLSGIHAIEWKIGALVKDRIIQPLIDKMEAILGKGKEVSENLARGIRQGATDAWDLVKSKFASLLNSIITVINRVPFVDIAPIKLAEGTIARRPTFALIGEDGPEAVIPLSRKHRRRGEHLMGLAQGMMGVQGEGPGPLAQGEAKQMARLLGVRMLGIGGIFGAAGNYAKDRAAALAGAARDGAMAPVNFARNQLGNLVGQIPTPSIGQPVLDGALRYVRDAAVAFIKGLEERKDSFSFSYGPARDWSERAMGLRYIWGGGHGGWNWNLPGYDCSGGASHALKKAGGSLSSPGTTFSLFPQTQIGAEGAFKLGFRGMGSQDPRGQHMGWKIGDTWYQFGPRKGGSDSQWTHVGVPRGLPGSLTGTDYVGSDGLRMIHGGEAVLNRQDAAAYRAGKAGTTVTVTVADGMEWLRDFMKVQIDDYAERSRRYGIAAGGVR